MERTKTWGEIWRMEFDAIGDSLELFNRNVLPWMRGQNLQPLDIRLHDSSALVDYKRIAHSEATKHGWKYDKKNDCYVDKT